MPNLKPSFGIIFHPRFVPSTLIDFAHRAEKGGFDEIWLWEDCFLAGALTSAAVILSHTEHIKVGIGLMPATVRNAAFTAMEISTLAALYPGRFLPGFGHGVDAWMKQIGAAPRSSLKALEETVNTIRKLLQGENVTIQGDHVHLDHVKLDWPPTEVPPLFVGAMREKSMHLAGRSAEGTILTEVSSPAYVRWAWEHIQAGMVEGKRTNHHLVVYVQSKVAPDGSGRDKVREVVASRFGWAEPHLRALGIADEARALYDNFGPHGAAERMPESWLDDLSASGTPENAAAAISRLADAGATSVVLQPLEADPDCLDEYIRYLLPLLK